MTNREILTENYEDAVLALLMDEFAESEGRRYIEENERLLQDPSAAVPEAFHARAMRVIDREFSKNDRAHAGGTLLRFLGRLAVAALIAVLLFGAAFALSETVRAGTLNFLLEMDAKIATWQFMKEEGADGSPADSIEIAVGWLPQGYSRDSFAVITPKDAVLDCTNSAGGVITVQVHASENYMHTLDMEATDYSSIISISGCQGMLTFKDGTYSVYWPYNDTELVVSITSSDVDSDTLIRMAESVSIIQ